MTTALPADGVRHDALLYGSTDELLAAAVPFLAEGLSRRETVVVVCTDDHNAMLAEAVGDPRVICLPREIVYAGAAQAVTAYARLVRRHQCPSSRVRIAGEVPRGDSAETWREWHRFEVVVNAALADLAVTNVCAYDLRHLPDEVRAGVEETHPAVLTPRGSVPNARYRDPLTVLHGIPSAEPDPLERTTPTLHLPALVDPAELPDVRARLRACLSYRGPHEQLRMDFVAAAAEVIANALLHGRAPVDVRLWAVHDRVLCVVNDWGRGFDDCLVGYLPPGERSCQGAGLWLARQACDTVAASLAPDGFSVRLMKRLPHIPPPVTVTIRRARDDAAALRATRARARAEALRQRLENRTSVLDALRNDDSEAPAGGRHGRTRRQ